MKPYLKMIQIFSSITFVISVLFFNWFKLEVFSYFSWCSLYLNLFHLELFFLLKLRLKFAIVFQFKKYLCPLLENNCVTFINFLSCNLANVHNWIQCIDGFFLFFIQLAIDGLFNMTDNEFNGKQNQIKYREYS